jgi:hypothetical protein
MINYINENVFLIEQKRLRDRELKRKGQITRLLKDAQDAIIEKSYDSARFLYQRILTLSPTASQEDFAKKKILSLNLALGLSQGQATNSDFAIKDTLSKENKDVLTTTSIKTNPKTNLPVSSAAKSENTIMNSNSNVLTNPSKKESIGDPVRRTISSENAAAPKASKTQKELVSKKTENAGLTIEKPDKKVTVKNSLTANSNKGLPEKKDKPVSPSSASIQKKSPPDEKVASVKEQKNADVLLDDAVKALNLKDYKGARLLYQQVLATKTSAGKKDFARMVIKAIEEELKKESKKIP